MRPSLPGSWADPCGGDKGQRRGRAAQWRGRRWPPMVEGDGGTEAARRRGRHWELMVEGDGECRRFRVSGLLGSRLSGGNRRRLGAAPRT
jgi:hypothetical protein